MEICEECSKMRIMPEYTKDQFVRKAWISLAKDDSPIDIFDENFDDVLQNEHQVLIDSIDVDVSYQVSVGYDRQEPYIDYEIYSEDEPYITTESYYDSAAKKTRQRQVTKYKKVQKQRQITKYKTVTDWSPLNGSHHTNAIAITENLPGEYLDESLFVSSFRGLKTESLDTLTPSEADMIQISESADAAVTSEQQSYIYSSILNSLPGDHSRDLTYKISDITASSKSVYITPEYKAILYYKGKTYEKRAFPFGAMKIDGDKIDNEISPEEIKEKKLFDLESRKMKLKADAPQNVWNKTKKLSFITTGLLVLSLILSCFVRVTALVVIGFIIAVAAFVYNVITTKAKLKAEEKYVNDEILDDTRKTNDEIADYQKNYKIEQRNALNRKLKSLGLSPVTSDEL